jgi:hypothetical protein
MRSCAAARSRGPRSAGPTLAAALLPTEALRSGRLIPMVRGSHWTDGWMVMVTFVPEGLAGKGRVSAGTWPASHRPHYLRTDSAKFSAEETADTSPSIRDIKAGRIFREDRPPPHLDPDTAGPSHSSPQPLIVQTISHLLFQKHSFSFADSCTIMQSSSERCGSRLREARHGCHR